MRRLFFLAAAATCLLLFAFFTGRHASAQDAAAQDAGEASPAAGEGSGQEPFIETTNTTVVNVEVYVTDRDGNPVTGLTAEDFEVLEDGDPVPVTNFFAVQGGRPVKEEVSELPDRRSTRPIDLPELPPEQQLHVILYVDNFNLFPSSRNRTLLRVRNFLSTSMGPNDRVMVVSYDRSLHLRQPFTSDMGAVANALVELESLSGSAALREQERTSTIETISDAGSEITALSAARIYAESVQAEMEHSLRALNRQIELLSGLVGRKALIYVSDGIPQVVGEDMFFYVDERFPRARARMEAGVFDMSYRYQQLVAKANSAGITMYAVDARGMRANSSVSAEFSGTVEGGGLAFIDSVNNANMREPLHRLADDTGGQAIVNTNAIEAGLKKFEADFRNYYSLGYQPARLGSGRYHKIDVKVKRKGLDVRHRHGYRDKSVAARMADSTLSSLVYGAASNPLEVDLAFGDVRRDDGKSLMQVDVQIPLGGLALVPQGSAYLGRVSIAVAVMDGEGGLSPVEHQPAFTIQIPEAEIEMARTKFYTYQLTLAMRPGLSRVAVTVRDELSARTSYVRKTVNVGA